MVACHSTHTFTLILSASRLSQRVILVLCISFAASFFNQIVNRLSPVELLSPPPVPLLPRSSCHARPRRAISYLWPINFKRCTGIFSFHCCLSKVLAQHTTPPPFIPPLEDTLNLILCKLQKQMRMCRRRDNPRNFKIYNS